MEQGNLSGGVRNMVGRRGDGGIRGFRIDDEIVCRDCIEEEELEESIERDIITKDDLRIHLVFCTRCKRQL